MNTSLSIHRLLNSPLSCYNIGTQKAGPLKRRWPCDIRSVKDHPATRQSYTRTVFYYAQNVKIKVSNAMINVANANINISAW